MLVWGHGVKMSEKSGMWRKNTLKRFITISEIYSMFNHTLNKDFTTPGETHDFWEYVYVNKGKLYVDTCNKIIQLNEGEFILHAPNDYHRHFVLDNSANIYIASFGCDYKGLQQISIEPIMLNQKAKNLIRESIQIASKIFDKYKNNVGFYKYENYNKLYEQLLSNCLESILITIINQRENDRIFIEPSNDLDNKNALLIKNVIQYLNNNIYDNISINDICKEFHVCKTSLANKFKKSTSKSIIDYFNHIKVLKSMQLLTDGKLNIGEVAIMLQYSSSQYFCKIFKKYTGVSPRTFLNQYACTSGLKCEYYKNS
jgi:AraC-like DNA-binding protein/quercetin dioxygenase-like cupin family protein